MQEVLARYPVLTQCDQFNVEELYSSPVNYHYYHLSICPRVNYQVIYLSLKLFDKGFQVITSILKEISNERIYIKRDF